MACSSNSTQLCGGPNALNVYQNTALATSTSATSTSAVPTTTFTASASVTTASSSSSASTRASAAQLVISSSSSSVLPTSSSSTSSSSASASSTSSSSSSSSATPFLLAGTKSVGCYIDSGSRSLSYTAYSNKQNTPSTCASTCRQLGYKYSGTEYSSECYCGNFLLNSAANGPVSSGCSMTCSGAPSQICGGSSRLSVVQDTQWTQSVFTVKKTGRWNFTDCIVDSTSKRSLSKSLSVSGNTPEKCLAACLAAKLPYCGMEYGGECYGSATAPTAASAPSVGSTDPIARGCSMPCTGNSSVVCGGSSRLNFYTYLGNNAVPVSPSVVM